jgi:hypothetical protein
MLCRHQDEFASPVPGDLDRLAFCLVLIFAEAALKFDSGRLRHRIVLSIAYAAQRINRTSDAADFVIDAVKRSEMDAIHDDLDNLAKSPSCGSSSTSTAR